MLRTCSLPWQFGYGLQRGTVETVAALNTMAVKIRSLIAAALDAFTHAFGHLRAIEGIREPGPTGQRLREIEPR